MRRLLAAFALALALVGEPDRTAALGRRAAECHSRAGQGSHDLGRWRQHHCPCRASTACCSSTRRSPAAAPRVMEEIRKLTSLPIRWVINTSSSPEHVAGNAVLVAPFTGRGGGRGAVRIRRPRPSRRSWRTRTCSIVCRIRRQAARPAALTRCQPRPTFSRRWTSPMEKPSSCITNPRHTPTATASCCSAGPT